MNIFHYFLQNRDQILGLTLEHLWLVGISTLLAVLIGLPLGVVSARWPAWNRPVLAGASGVGSVISSSTSAGRWTSGPRRALSASIEASGSPSTRS